MERERDIMSTAYDEGVKAYWQEVAISDCPYDPSTIECELWCQGWVTEADTDEGFDMMFQDDDDV